MKITLLRGALAWILAVGLAGATPTEDHQELLEILEVASSAKSDAAQGAAFVAEAEPLARAIATATCASGARFGIVPGPLAAGRLLRRIGAIALHRHGSATAANQALDAGREIILGSGACLTGNEMNAAGAALAEKASAASGISDGVPAGNPGLLSAPDPSDHCAQESPNLSLVYAQALAWANSSVLAAPVRAVDGGNVTCDSGDPQFIWKVELVVKQGATTLPSMTVAANVNDLTFSP